MTQLSKNKFSFILLTLLLFTNGISSAAKNSENKANNSQKMESLVTARWLNEHLNDSDLIVLDTTVIVKPDDKGGFSLINGRASYDAGHIPSAGFADLLGSLSAKDDSLQFVMPTPKEFSQAIGKLGIGNDSRVVLYSQGRPSWAARVWWMLRWAGLEQVAILDGGLKAWKAEGLPISKDTTTHPAKQFKLSLRSEMIANRDEVLAAINNSNVRIVDALSSEHYQGKFTMYARPGHIPSASNSPSSNLLDKTGQYRSIDELEMMHEGDPNKRVITYCGGGIAASSVAFTMYRLGFKDVAVYMGSLQEWAADPENPMTVDHP